MANNNTNTLKIKNDIYLTPINIEKFNQDRYKKLQSNDTLKNIESNALSAKKKVSKTFNSTKEIECNKQYELKDINLQSYLNNLKDDVILICHLLLRFYWLVCRVGVVETLEELDKFTKEYPNRVQFIIIGRDNYGLTSFVTEDYYKGKKIFIDKEMKLYKTLGSKAPGLFECFGFCYKNTYNKMKQYTSKGNVKADKMKMSLNSQLGGTIILSNKSDILFKHAMKYAGDHYKPEELITSVQTILGINNNCNNNIYNNNNNIIEYDYENKSHIDKVSNKSYFGINFVKNIANEYNNNSNNNNNSFKSESKKVNNIDINSSEI